MKWYEIVGAFLRLYKWCPTCGEMRWIHFSSIWPTWYPTHKSWECPYCKKQPNHYTLLACPQCGKANPYARNWPTPGECEDRQVI